MASAVVLRTPPTELHRRQMSREEAEVARLPLLRRGYETIRHEHGGHWVADLRMRCRVPAAVNAASAGRTAPLRLPAQRIADFRVRCRVPAALDAAGAVFAGSLRLPAVRHASRGESELLAESNRCSSVE